jgi:hypothetical protein
MSKIKVLPAIALFLLAVFAFNSVRAQEKNAFVLRLSQTIALPGVTGGFDHFAYDPLHKRLFLAAEDHGTVEVIDLVRGQQIRSINGFKNPHSMLFRPGASTLLVTDSGPAASALVDATTLQRTRTLKFALGANCILFDVQRKMVYLTAGGDRVGETRSTLQAVNPDTGDVLKSVTVDAMHLQPMALDLRTGRLFVNLADQNAIGIYDRDTLGNLCTSLQPASYLNKL